ncbi:MAG TPA: MFS transporter [Fibrobacteres bacterium]|jgi:POT family proton-dependent oligopeptide transporter|nr:MFS transporter [Fibrobacterota bacterium]
MNNITHSPDSRDTAFFGHPRGLSTLFFTELWERFSYYGMRAILILFMTAAVTQGGLGFPTAKAGLIYATYTSMVYLMAVPGGWIADKFLGLRKAVLFGGIIIMAGHICLAIPATPTFYLGLAFVVVGTGLLKPNISATVGGLYGPEDARRDSGFSIYYMGINLGAFISPLVVGWLAQSDRFKATLGGMGIAPENSWHFGFGMAAIGMFLGLMGYVRGWKHLGEVGMRPNAPESPEAARRDRRKLRWGIGSVIALLALVTILAGQGLITVTPEKVGRIFGYVLSFTPLVLFPYLYFFCGFSRHERKQLIVIMVLFFGSAVFWSLLEQAGSTLNLFAERNTDTSSIPSSFFQSVGPLSIVLLAPVIAALWTWLGKRQPSSPAKFALGLLFATLGFAVLIIAARLSAQGVKVSPLWLLATYLLHTLGELCLSPVGLSAMTKLAPQRIVGFVLGIWFLATSLGNFMAGFASSMYESMPLNNLFILITGIALVATLLMAASIRPIRRMLERD